jgi:hypothetical protein
MTIAELKQQATQARDKARSLKTKKAQLKAYNLARDFERQAFGKLCDERDKYGKFSFKATVNHFNPKNEHYLVETPYGSMWLSPTADILSKSWYSHTCCIEYTKEQIITVEAQIDANLDRLTLEIIPGKVTGGTVNETQYAELCQRDDLAFFKYPTGMTGLFK